KGLPLAGLAAHVDHRRPLVVHGRTLPFGIGLVVVRVEHLDLITSPHEADAVVAASLPAALDIPRRGEFQVEVAIAETPFGLDGSLDGEATIVVHFPARSTVPGVEVLAIEEYAGVRWRFAAFAGRHHRRLGPDDAAEVPLPQRGADNPCRHENDRHTQQPLPHRIFLSLSAYPLVVNRLARLLVPLTAICGHSAGTRPA